MKRGVGPTGKARMAPMRTGELRKRALDVLGRADLGSVYDAAQLRSGDASVDTAMKVLLAEKLVESIERAQKYARKAKMKRIGASTVLIAAQEGRW